MELMKNDKFFLPGGMDSNRMFQTIRPESPGPKAQTPRSDISIGEHWGNLPAQINNIKRGETDSEFGNSSRNREKERFLSVNDHRRSGRDSE